MGKINFICCCNVFLYSLEIYIHWRFFIKIRIIKVDDFVDNLYKIYLKVNEEGIVQVN